MHKVDFFDIYREKKIWKKINLHV